MAAIFQYRVLGRTSLALPGLIAGLVMLILAMRVMAPVWVWAILLPCLAICLTQVALRPIYGIRLSPALLEIFDGFHEQALPITQIAYLRITGPDTDLVLHNGSVIPLPRRAMPNPLALIREMTARDIPVRQSHGS